MTPAGVRRVSAAGLNYSRVARKQRREGKSCLHPLGECEDDGRAQPGWISAQNVPALVGEKKKEEEKSEKKLCIFFECCTLEALLNCLYPTYLLLKLKP